MLFRKRPIEIYAEVEKQGREIKTMEGIITANPGDWIITGVKGEQYPCKPDIFFKTYEPVDNEARAAWNKVYGCEPMELCAHL